MQLVWPSTKMMIISAHALQDTWEATAKWVFIYKTSAINVSILFSYTIWRLSVYLAPGVNCREIRNQGNYQDGMYLLDLDGGSQSNAFLAYCDMTSYNGGWTMCCTTDEYVKPRTEVTYSAQFPFGSDGYRTNCNNIPVSWLTCIRYFSQTSFPVICSAMNLTNWIADHWLRLLQLNSSNFSVLTVVI